MTDYPEYDSRNKYFNTQISRLLKVKRTQLEMIRDRGYEIKDEEWMLTCSVDEFFNYLSKVDEVNRYTTLSNTYVNSDKQKLFVYYPAITASKSVTSCDISPVINVLSEMRKIIIIGESQCDPGLKKQLEQLQAKRLFSGINDKFLTIQYFTYDELSYNPTKNKLVSKHKLLTKEQAYEDLLKYTSFDKLPMISVDDKISKYYGVEVGDIFEITTESNNPLSEGLTDDSIFYRAVVKDDMV